VLSEQQKADLPIKGDREVVAFVLEAFPDKRSELGFVFDNEEFQTYPKPVTFCDFLV